MKSILELLNILLLDFAFPVLIDSGPDLLSVQADGILLLADGFEHLGVSRLVLWSSGVVDHLVVDARRQEALSYRQIWTVLESSDVPLTSYKALVQGFSPLLLFG